MSSTNSATNRVVADEPGPDDTHCQLVWFGPSQDGQHRKVFEGPVEPIENYGATVAWAVEMAAHMVQPLYVVPLTGVEVLRTEQVRAGVASLTGQQCGQHRREVVTMLAQIMRDCADPVVRADAYDVLQQMKVIAS